MLDRLIESKRNTKETKRLGGFLLTTATGAFFVLLFALIYSLFAYNVALAGDDLTVSAIVAPVQISEQKPPEERATAAPKQRSIEKSIDKLPTRRENIQRVDEAPVKTPDAVSVVRSQNQARPDSAFRLGNNDLNPAAAGVYTNERGAGTGAGSGVGISDSMKTSVDGAAKTAVVAPPPVVEPVVKSVVKEAEPPKKTVVISGGVVNGKASNLVTPVYSPAAKAVRASGEVRVAVTIDENGRVISASALGGHPLLAAAAVSAARASKFTPTFLSNQRVRVTGIIVYNFKV